MNGNDGLCTFGFGVHDGTAEIMCEKYNTLGYSSVFHKNDAYKTQKIVEQINEELIDLS